VVLLLGFLSALYTAPSRKLTTVRGSEMRTALCQVLIVLLSSFISVYAPSPGSSLRRVGDAVRRLEEEEGGEEEKEEEDAEEEGEESSEVKQVKTAVPATLTKIEKLNYPDAFFLGVQKCGVTTVSNVIFGHPHVCNKGSREKHFFTEKDYINHLGDYKNEYAECKKEQLTIDATPKYIFGTEIAERINKTYDSEELAQKRFVVLLREPVQRQYSEYQRLLRTCFRLIDETQASSVKKATAGRKREKKTSGEQGCSKIIHSAPTKHPTKAVQPISKDSAMLFFEWTGTEYGKHEQNRGNYLFQLKHWLKFIKRKQLLVLNFETLIVNTTDTFFRLSAFLKINADFIINDKKNQQIVLPPPPPANAYVDWPQSVLYCRTHQSLETYYTSKNDGLFEFINGAKDKPFEEPWFPPFKSSKNKCKDV